MVGYIFLGDREEVMHESVLSSKSSHRAATISDQITWSKKLRKLFNKKKIFSNKLTFQFQVILTQ